MPSTTVLTEICPFNQICPQSGRLSSNHRMEMDKVIKGLPGQRIYVSYAHSQLIPLERFTGIVTTSSIQLGSAFGVPIAMPQTP